MAFPPHRLRIAAALLLPLLALVIILYPYNSARQAGEPVPAPASHATDYGSGWEHDEASPFVLVVEPLAPRLPPVPPSAPLPRYPLIVPVQGVSASELIDTFSQPRGNVRRHLAIDILAPTGTPVIAATDGTVVRLHRGGKGGLTVYIVGPAGDYVYYYAHLDAYADGLEAGVSVRQGDAIGYVGHTGNAHEDAPHLHFAIWQQRPGASGWGGRAVNPYLALTR